MKVKNQEELVILMRATKPDDYKEGMTVEEITEVLQKDGSRVRRLKTFSQAQSAKQSWRQNRSTFMAGIKRFHRNGNVDLRKKVADKLNNWGKLSPFTGDRTSDSQYEYFSLKDRIHFDVYEFMGEVASLISNVLEVAGTFALEEQFVDSAIFADIVVRDLHEFIRLILENEKVPAPILETLLILVEPELFENKTKISGDLVGGYSKLIKTK